MNVNEPAPLGQINIQNEKPSPSSKNSHLPRGEITGCMPSLTPDPTKAKPTTLHGHTRQALKIWETIVTLKCYLTPRFPSLASQSAQFEHSSRDSVDLKRCPGDSETPGRLRTTHLTGPHELSEPEWPLQWPQWSSLCRQLYQKSPLRCPFKCLHSLTALLCGVWEDKGNLSSFRATFNFCDKGWHPFWVFSRLNILDELCLIIKL